MSTVTLATPQKPENGAARGQAATQVELGGGGGGVRGQLSSMSGLLIRKCCLSLQGVHRVGPVLDTYSQSDINLPAARLDALLGSESLSAAPQSSGVLFRAAPASRSYYGIEKQQRGGEVSSQLSPSEAKLCGSVRIQPDLSVVPVSGCKQEQACAAERRCREHPSSNCQGALGRLTFHSLFSRCEPILKICAKQTQKKPHTLKSSKSQYLSIGRVNYNNIHLYFNFAVFDITVIKTGNELTQICTDSNIGNTSDLGTQIEFNYLLTSRRINLFWGFFGLFFFVPFKKNGSKTINFGILQSPSL